MRLEAFRNQPMSVDSLLISTNYEIRKIPSPSPIGQEPFVHWVRAGAVSREESSETVTLPSPADGGCGSTEARGYAGARVRAYACSSVRALASAHEVNHEAIDYIKRGKRSPILGKRSPIQEKRSPFCLLYAFLTHHRALHPCVPPPPLPVTEG